VTEDGIVHGWIGGSCAEPTVRDEARRALVDGQCRVVQITPKPSPSTEREGLVVVPMTCYSGGELEIYLEPHLAKAELLIFGNSPVAQALVQMGAATGYRVSVVDVTDRPALTGADALIHDLAEVALTRPSQAAVVVATHGVFDEDAIECGLGLGAAYLGVVASPRRFASLRSTMKARGVSQQAWSTIDGPAGIDIGARTPQEIAISVIAAITARRESIRVMTKRPDREEQVSAEPTAPASVAEGSPAGGCCHDEGSDSSRASRE
jgi:xanthine dehydrogenase accessory factor